MLKALLPVQIHNSFTASYNYTLLRRRKKNYDRRVVFRSTFGFEHTLTHCVYSGKICPEGIRDMFLPQVIKDRLPDDIVHLINAFLPIKSRKKKHMSPSLQRELEKIQKLTLKGKTGMYLREFMDFSID